MVRAELALRLNDREYTNWLKAGRCLLILRSALHPFINQHMTSFHADLLNQNTVLRKPCVSSCRPRGNQLTGACTLCAEWQRVIMRHHRQHDATVNWDNCSPPSWRTDHWEVAKVIRYRNELMHSCEMQVTSEWMRHYQSTLRHFVQQLRQVPEMARAEKEIKEECMLSAELTVCVSGSDRLDSAVFEGLECDSYNQSETNADLISQWETELLQEKLQELLYSADDDAATQDSEQLRSLAGFLQVNRDLSEKFSAELQVIRSLKDRQ
ncbi:hypothetical protein INR49_000338 [Caranx melampygus]|nr:hypothetical protein INR49_000338 [Caranx melampygus]